MIVDQNRESEWRQFVIHLDSLEPAEIETVFARHGAMSVTLADAGDTPILQSARESPEDGLPLWGETRISALFGPDLDLASLCEDLQQTLSLDRLPEHRVEIVEDRAWEREWLTRSGPMRFGSRLWVCPGGTDAGAPDAVTVQLDPGLAFGTGSHETTALCLEWLDGLDLAGRTVLDFGCGSGVLAIAAVRLGAHSACAFDIDPQAVATTLANAAVNGVSERVLATGNLDEISGTYDVVVANILAEPLADLAGWICDHLASGGRIALSGILRAQVEAVTDAYRQWVRFDPPKTENDWVRLTGTRT